MNIIDALTAPILPAESTTRHALGCTLCHEGEDGGYCKSECASDHFSEVPTLLSCEVKVRWLLELASTRSLPRYIAENIIMLMVV